MSSFENRSEDLVQEQSNVTTSTAEEAVNSGLPALESTFPDLDEIADILKSEAENVSPKLQDATSKSEGNCAAGLETASETLELSGAEIEHFANFVDMEETDFPANQENNPVEATNIGCVNKENTNDATTEDNVDNINENKNCSLKDESIKSPGKEIEVKSTEDVVLQKEETSNAQQEICDTEEKDKVEKTEFSDPNTLLTEANDDPMESCELFTIKEKESILSEQEEIEETKSPKSSTVENDNDGKSMITENIKIDKSLEIDEISKNDMKSVDLDADISKTLENEKMSNATEFDNIPTSTNLEDRKTEAEENSDNCISKSLENDTSKQLESDEISKPTEEESVNASKSSIMETDNITKSVEPGSDEILKCVERDSENGSKPLSIEIDNTAEPNEAEGENLVESVAGKNLDLSEQITGQNEEIPKSADIEIETSKPTTMKNDDNTKESKSIETTVEESIEPMDICDSQESINLVIDEEMSRNTANKTDEETNMEVDLIECTTEKSDKPAENIVAESVVKKDDDNINDKSKDDDVIPIEQPPVPVIEIDDEEEIEPNKKEKDCTVNGEIASKGKEDKASESNTAKKDYEKETKETMEQTDEILLEKTSEKPLDDDIVMPDILKSPKETEVEETNDEVFYHKECINYECPHKHKQYFKVPQFAFSYFKVTKKKFKTQYICAICYDKALDMYEEFCGLISAKQPLLLENIPSGRQEFVEIIDSSDDEDSCSNKTKTVEATKTDFSKSDLALIKSELNDTIKAVLNRVDIQNQLTWSKTILSERLKRLEIETEYVDTELKALQRKADKMHEGLYSCPKIKIRQLPPLDLNSGKLMTLDPVGQKDVQAIPPVGEIERPTIQQNGVYYAVKNNPIASWVPCRVIEQVESSLINSYNVKHYKIKFTKNQTLGPKTVPAKYLAYYDPPAVRLPIGTRVIAYFDATSLARGREKINVQSAFYPGIIAEPLKPNNKFRYLIFYDDGYTQYVYHKDVRLVCHVSECVWEDVHPASRDFIQKYLTQYSINRPMVQTQKGQSMNTESNGYWLHARVVDIDCSLVLMQFEGSKSHTEWIYRGSLRLGPVFKEYQKSLQKNSSMPVSRLPRRTEPFIRYTEDEETSSTQQQHHQHATEKSADGNRAVARKTFGRPESMMNSGQPNSYNTQQQQQPAVKHLNNSTIYVEDENKPKGKVVYYTAKRNLPPLKYKPHKCQPSCQFKITHNLSAYSPLSKPLLSGWERFIIRQKIKRVVTYRAPCGKILRNMKELHHYLRATKNVLNVDNFDFSHEINCLAEYVIESAIIQKRDISCGQEKMAIPLVNYYDNTLPPECKYSAKVIPTEGVHINTDPEFLVGCDCEDDCMDKSKCSCWQLTLGGAKYGNPNATPEEVGYQYRRLLEHVPTGIYECNANCKCKSSCLNRLVQNSLTMKLQVFKTSNRGWGLRCINDIPRGSFVCVYAGHLLTEAKANEGGQDAGDEYFAELDYIEVAEQIKEGYESDVEPAEPEEEEPYNPELDGDGDFTPSKSFLTRSRQKQNALKSRTSNQEEDSQERQVINFNPNADMNEDSVRENSIRKLYGRDEACYVMDAKISGNLGRYFNHSCAPNMFVQNVFVNTHDLRFPNVAFFSSCNIRAGTELTWNYNYEVGVVPGKVLYCQCGAPNCRLRLL